MSSQRMLWPFRGSGFIATCINSMMVEFPYAFNLTQKISEDKMKDLLKFSIPWHWRMEMVRQAFRPLGYNIIDIIEFCECQETCESFAKAYKTISNVQAVS